MSRLFSWGRLRHPWLVSLIAAGLWALGVPSPAVAQLEIYFDNAQIIQDGGAGDLDGLVNDKIDFAGIYGTSGYSVQGSLRSSPTWPVGPTLNGYSPPITGALTLTNFVAEAVSTSTINTTLGIRIRNQYLGSFTSGTALDSVTAEVGNSLLFPVPPGTDLLQVWATDISDIPSGTTPITPATGAARPLGNPFHPGPGTTPYPITGDGPTPIPALTNPVIQGLLVINLGQFNDQFILPNSAEVGFSANLVPEPAMGGLIGLTFILAARRRRVVTR